MFKNRIDKLIWFDIKKLKSAGEIARAFRIKLIEKVASPPPTRGNIHYTSPLPLLGKMSEAKEVQG